MMTVDQMRKYYKDQSCGSNDGDDAISALLVHIDYLDRQVIRLVGERDSEHAAREKCSAALRAKDEAMGVLFKRLQAAGVDCSDLIS